MTTIRKTSEDTVTNTDVSLSTCMEYSPSMDPNGNVASKTGTMVQTG